jgi:hypothetical protein
VELGPRPLPLKVMDLGQPLSEPLS